MKTISLLIAICLSFSAVCLKPDRSYLSHPDSLGLESKSYLIPTADGAELKTWVLQPMGEMDQKTTIILAYGDGGNMSYWLDHCATLSQKGYTVVLFDYRGFGESSDFDMDPNQLYYDEFVVDLIAVFDWTKANVKTEKLGIWGLSMGTIITGLSLKERKPDFLILEGTVTDPQVIKERIFEFKQEEISLPKSSEELSTAYKTTQIPMLIFSGKEDKFTTLQDSQQMAEIRVNRKLIEFNGNHLQGFAVLSNSSFGDGYVEEIERMISQ